MTNHSETLPIALICAALASAAACSPDTTGEGTPKAPLTVSAAPPATAFEPTSSPPLKDPSLPDASTALRNDDLAASADKGRDTARNDPKGDLTKSKESQSMPLAGHGNNHSSPSIGTDTVQQRKDANRK